MRRNRAAGCKPGKRKARLPLQLRFTKIKAIKTQPIKIKGRAIKGRGNPIQTLSRLKPRLCRRTKATAFRRKRTRMDIYPMAIRQLAMALPCRPRARLIPAALSAMVRSKNAAGQTDLASKTSQPLSAGSLLSAQRPPIVTNLKTSSVQMMVGQMMKSPMQKLKSKSAPLPMAD